MSTSNLKKTILELGASLPLDHQTFIIDDYNRAAYTETAPTITSSVMASGRYYIIESKRNYNEQQETEQNDRESV